MAKLAIFYGKICQFLWQNLAKFRISNGNFLRCQVYLRWVNIDTKVLGTLLFIVVCLTGRNERHLVIFFKSRPGNVKKSDYIGAKFYYQMPFISSSELFSRI